MLELLEVSGAKRYDLRGFSRYLPRAPVRNAPGRLVGAVGFQVGRGGGDRVGKP
jgi:hypothetical protein